MLDLAELDSTWCEQSDPEIEAWDLRGTRSGVRITVDEGVYLGSVPTMYRILREETLTGIDSSWSIVKVARDPAAM